jgi:hypothetical protein
MYLEEIHMQVLVPHSSICAVQVPPWVARPATAALPGRRDRLKVVQA